MCSKHVICTMYVFMCVFSTPVPQYTSTALIINLFFPTDLTMSVLGSESGLMSSFLSSEEIGELLDKVLRNMQCLHNLC